VTLQILPRKGGPDWVFVSPWDQRTLVPPFANESESFVPVVLGERGSRDLLASDQAIKAVAARTLEQLGPRLDKSEITDEERKRVLAEQAAAFGLKPEEVDKAIRAWGTKAEDPYDAGLAALYERNYPKAVERLTESLELRRQERAEADAKVAEAAFFLGQTLYEQGNYREAAAAYRESLDAGGEESIGLNNLGLALLKAGDLQGASSPLQRSLELDEKRLALSIRMWRRA
jgi:tetratricopeptide (TPR) repeat protein